MSLISPHRPVAIDPPGCGCTECMTGEYVPLDQATNAQILDLLAGRLRDNTDEATEFTLTLATYGDQLTWSFCASDVIEALKGGAR